MEWPSEDEDETYSQRKRPSTKYRKANTGKPIAAGHRATRASTSHLGLLEAFQHGLQPGPVLNHTKESGDSFESVIEPLLPDYLHARHGGYARLSDGTQGVALRSLSRFETTALLDHAKKTATTTTLDTSPESLHIIMRKLALQRQRRQVGVPDSLLLQASPAMTLNPLTPLTPPPPSPSDPALLVLEHLSAIRTTRYECSFASRLYGARVPSPRGLIYLDWVTRTPWMDLMDDVHAHHAFAHPEREQIERSCFPIAYVSLQPEHLVQVHDLLARTFWEGIDVGDSLQYSPERCTVVAMYRHLVVGAAFLSSPQETYITYLVVRAGWENSQIATTMLYHLISLNPHRDITLHVSANNPAMLLYNRFGFKAEGFITGFYEDYLNSQSRSSMNAFRLRLRR